MITAIPDEFTVHVVTECRNQWLPLLHVGDDVVRLSGANVTAIDGAGLQLLIAFERGLMGHGKTLAIAAPSLALRQAFEMASWVPGRNDGLNEEVS